MYFQGCYDALEDQVLKETTNFICLTAFCFAFAVNTFINHNFLIKAQYIY